MPIPAATIFHCIKNRIVERAQRRQPQPRLEPPSSCCSLRESSCCTIWVLSVLVAPTCTLHRKRSSGTEVCKLMGCFRSVEDRWIRLGLSCVEPTAANGGCQDLSRRVVVSHEGLQVSNPAAVPYHTPTPSIIKNRPLKAPYLAMKNPRGGDPCPLTDLETRAHVPHMLSLTSNLLRRKVSSSFLSPSNALPPSKAPLYYLPLLAHLQTGKTQEVQACR